MRSSLAAALRWLVLPWGKVTGRRIVINGDSGSIDVYDESDFLTAKVFAENEPYGNGGGFASFSVNPPVKYVSALSGGEVTFQAADEFPDLYAYINYQRAGAPGADVDPATLEISSGYPGHTFGSADASLRLVSRVTSPVTEAYVEVGSYSGVGSRCDLRVKGAATSDDERFGRVSITPSGASVPTSATVTYAAMVGTIFEGYTTANTSAPGTIILGTAVQSLTATSALIWVTRTNTTPVVVHWLVKGR